jgi:AraC-like DNA-binding protein/tetratricopeptide (TPR) repeat protein
MKFYSADKIIQLLFHLLFYSLTIINVQSQEKQDSELRFPVDFSELEKEIRSNLYSDARSSHTFALQYLDAALSEGVDSLEATAYYFLGITNYFLGRYHLSNGYYNKALDNPYAQAQPSFAEKCYNNMGVNYEVLNMRPQALDAYHKSLAMAQKLGDSVSIAQTWINIGLLDIVSGNLDRGLSTTGNALAFFESIDDSLNMALCYQNIGKAWTEKGDRNLSLEYDKRSLLIYEAIGNLFGTADLHFNIARSYFTQGYLDSSEAYLREAEALANANGFDKVKGSIFLLWAKIEQQRGATGRAEGYLNAALALFKKLDMPNGLVDVYLDLASLYSTTGNKEAHSKAISNYRREWKELQERTAAARYDELMVLYEQEKNIRTIEEQAAKIKSIRKRIAITTIIAVVLLLNLAIILWLYFKMRKYLKSLYQNNMAQVRMKLPEVATPPSGNAETVRLAELYRKIMQLMEEKEFYRRQDLSIAQISDELATNDKYVSQAINQFSSSNFNSFVNTFRVNEARRLMVKDGHRLLVKDIAEKSGFGNINTFNKKFKEVTGLTPKMFIEMSLEEKLNDGSTF